MRDYSLPRAFKRLGIVAAGGLILAGLSSHAFAKTDLLVYTAVEADELAGFKKAIEADVKDINIKWVRDSTGVITSKLLAEIDNKRADIVWGLAATSLLFLADKGYFQPYAPKGVEKLDKRYVDTQKPPRWVGQRAWLASVCYNNVEGGKKKLPLPTSWADLAKPVYKGHIIMPNPNSSGTGFLDVSSWIQLMGDKKAWEYMDALHENIARYTHSGSAPCKLAATGEIAIGISFAYRGAKSKAGGAPIEVIAPSEGIGWDLESFAIVKGTKNLAAARKLADWSVGKTANKIYNKEYAVVAMPGIATPVKHFPPGIEGKMIANDFSWAAKNRTKILDEWRKRYDAKSEPKKK